ncbi:MAG TPA: LpqB family beta-propeller domain-containing protein [Candidatus Elarobacter sp.]|jgi:Tol biopolymer transport system component|nr:LpqB family beta-propeller domain-containing protein [Candidatus Elarobacter sp.]
MLVRRALTAAALLACVLSGIPITTNAADTVVAGTHSFGEPSVSPDHAEIAFVSGGDVWSVPSGGGTARLLAAVGGGAHRPLFSPDGKRLAFVDTQPGEAGVYVLTLDGGALRRLTHDDVVPDVSGWSPDGRYVYFSTSSHQIAYFGDVYRVSADGGTPMHVLHEPYINEMFAAPSPDGASLAFVRNGFTQWWRRGHSHMDETELVVAHPGTNRFDTITNGDAKDQWPMWSPDGRTLYFVSDRSGADNLWARTSDGRMRKLTAFTGGRVLWPTISRDGRVVAFERGMRIWTYDVESGSARELAIVPRGLPDVAGERHLTLANRFSSLDLSPDGKKIAFVARGRIFAAAAQEGGAAQLVTTHGDAAYDLPVWAPGSRRIAYTIDRGTETAIATYDFPDGPQRVVTPAGHHDDYPHWSPDGKTLAFVRDGRELHLLDVASRADRIVARGIMDRRPFGDLGDVAFSPAGDWIAYVETDPEGFGNAYVVRTSGGTPRAVTFLPNANSGPLAWSPDGTRLFMTTSQRTENGGIAQVDLIPRTPRFREETFRRLFDEPVRPELPSRTVPTPVPSGAPRPSASPSPAATSSPARRTEIDFTNIRERVSFVQTGLDVTRVAVTPDSKTLVLVANAAGQENVYTFSVDETSEEPQVAKQITSAPGPKRSVSITPDGKNVVYLDAGRAFVADITGKGSRPIPLAAELDVNFTQDKRLVFDQAWSLLDRWYADPNFHGANWNAVRADYEPYALGARTPQELYRVLSLMIGELNSSHTGIGPQRPTNVPPFTLGRLGVDWDAAAYERTGRLRVASVVPLGPAAVAGHIVPGDEILAVDGTPVDRTTDVDALLANRIGKRTELRVAPRGDAAAARSVFVLPVDRSAEERLRYLAWVAQRRAYVERVSGGRLGYVHIYDMGEQSLAKFYTDLDVQNRAKAGVIVDVRNNLGGFVDPYAIDVLTRREYARFKSRFGYDPPERTSLGERALDKPTALVTNEHSLSDAENFTEAYRQLHAGPVVGEPTAGWIIFTSAAQLADGGTVRLPSTRVIGHDGVDLELHPRPVDVRAAYPPGAEERGEDPQLDAAVRELLRRVRRP